jgi:hypothetical protein
LLRVVRVKRVAPNKYMGRRPIACYGNSDGDRKMLMWTPLRRGRAGNRCGGGVTGRCCTNGLCTSRPRDSTLTWLASAGAPSPEKET